MPGSLTGAGGAVLQIPDNVRVSDIRPDERSGVIHPANLTRFAARWLDPAPSVASVVDRYWHTRWALADGEVIGQRILTLPAVTLSIEAGDVPAGLVLTGVHRRAWCRDIQGTGDVFALRLRPAGLVLLGATTLTGCADATLPVEDPGTLALLEAVADGASPDERARLADAAIGQWLAAVHLDDELLLANAVLDALTARVRTRTGPGLAAELGVSERAVQRAMRRTLGQGPKWVARWIRLQELARALAVQPEPDLAALAVELGYTDQAHLTRDFASAVGTTPGAYARSVRRMAGT